MEAVKKIADEGVEDPFLHPPTLARTVKVGILDTPHLQGLTVAQGEIKTEIIEGKCLLLKKHQRSDTRDRSD